MTLIDTQEMPMVNPVITDYTVSFVIAPCASVHEQSRTEHVGRGAGAPDAPDGGKQ
jgi:hypothetical protein